MKRPLKGIKTIYGIKFLPPAILIVLITIGMNMVLEDALDQYQHHRMELALVYQMSAIRARLEKDINNSLVIIHGVEGNISMNPDITREGFKTLARRMMHHPNLINNMATAPDFIITYMYPESGNETAIGVDYRDIPAQWLPARKARDTKELVLAGPVDLLQGGTGFIGHAPVFVETPNGEVFWGLVSAVIREDRLYRHAGLDEKSPGLQIAIRGRDGLGPRGDVFHGDPSLFDPASQAVLMPVSLPNGSFLMAGIPKGGWTTEHPYPWAIRISSAIAASLALLYVMTRIRATERRRQADREIREAQQHTFKILESTTDAFFEVDDQFNLTYINRRAEESIGLSKSSHIGRNLWDVLGRAIGTRFHDECLRALREQEVVSLEEHYPPLNKWYQMYAYPTPASLSVYFHDITESRQMALEREALFQLSLDLIVIAGFDGYFKELNPSWERVLGWPRETLLARPWLDFVHPDDIRSTKDAALVLAKGENVVSFENRYKCRDGSWRWMSWNAFPVTEREQIFAVVRDVTETIKARKILQQDRDELETRVEERTIALAEANRKLRRAKEEAEAANRAKTDFLANVSHELRTPLNPIIGLTDYLQETPLEDEQRRFIVDIRDSAGRLLKIINNLIELTMIDSQGLELDLQPFSLAQMLKALVKETEPEAKARGLTVEARIGRDTPELVESNSRQIRRVLTLLLENAVKFTEQGRITLAVDLDLNDTGWTGLHFTVTDTGIGIPPEKIDSLFEDLTQVDTSTTRMYGGLGLGLSLARRIVSKMGGKIWVELPEEGGSRFHVILPFGECCHL